MTSALEERVQRKATQRLINSLPTTLVLIPRSQVGDGAGGWRWVLGTPRDPQTMRLIEYNTRAGTEPILTADGRQRYIDFELMAMPEAQIGLYDIFEHDGDKWEIISMMRDHPWSLRASVARFGD